MAWKRRMPPIDADKYYGFTLLAAQLNEPEEGVAPTDSRLRPDQRLMEEGRWDEANSEKLRLEEKQRATRRSREAEAEAAASQGNLKLKTTHGICTLLTNIVCFNKSSNIYVLLYTMYLK